MGRLLRERQKDLKTYRKKDRKNITLKSRKTEKQYIYGQMERQKY